jgi:hypothetical protein
MFQKGVVLLELIEHKSLCEKATPKIPIEEFTKGVHIRKLVCTRSVGG